MIISGVLTQKDSVIPGQFPVSPSRARRLPEPKRSLCLLVKIHSFLWECFAAGRVVGDDRSWCWRTTFLFALHVCGAAVSAVNASAPSKFQTRSRLKGRRD